MIAISKTCNETETENISNTDTVDIEMISEKNTY